MSAKTHPVCRVISLPALFLLFFQSVSAQKKPAPVENPLNGIEAIVKQQSKTMGKEVVAMVNQGGRNLYTLQTPDFNPRTPMPVAEASMWLTAAVVLIHVDEGKIGLDDKVSKYIPEFSRYFKGYITVRHCLSHLTGVEAEATGVMKVTQKNRFEDLNAEVQHLISKREIINNTGEAFHYSQVGMNIAARVVEVVSKRTFDRAAMEKLFRPLGMRQTTFFDDKGGVNPSMGATSSGLDFMNFLTMLLDTGMYKGKRILSKESVGLMLNPSFKDLPVKYAPAVAREWAYGMGAWLEDGGNGKPAMATAPGSNGFWPWIDLNRRYAALVMPQKEPSELKPEIYRSIREEIEANIR